MIRRVLFWGALEETASRTSLRMAKLHDFIDPLDPPGEVVERMARAIYEAEWSDVAWDDRGRSYRDMYRRCALAALLALAAIPAPTEETA